MVGYPLDLITSEQRLGIEWIYLVSSPSASSHLHSWPKILLASTVAGLIALTLLVKMLQRFSIGFKSGEFASQFSKNFKPSSRFHFLVILLWCFGSPSSWNVCFFIKAMSTHHWKEPCPKHLYIYFGIHGTMNISSLTQKKAPKRIFLWPTHRHINDAKSFKVFCLK